MPAMERATAELRLSPQFEDTARLYSWLEEVTAARGLSWEQCFEDEAQSSK